MEKIKVIDLLNRIQNYESINIPDKIKYNDRIWEYDYSVNDFRYEYKDNYSQDTLLFNDYLCNLTNCLNDEVEILEEDKKIEKIDMFDYFTGYDFDGTSKDLLKHLERNFEKTNEKLNEIIDYINKENK